MGGFCDENGALCYNGGAKPSLLGAVDDDDTTKVEMKASTGASSFHGIIRSDIG